MKRRAFLGGVAAIAATGIGGAAFARRSRDDVLRVGVMTNLTHAPLLAGLGSGRIAAAMAPIAIEARAFRAGPRVCEALVGDAIDAGAAGAAAIVIHHARSGRLRVLSGISSGGASFIVAKDSGIRSAADVRGKVLAVTQIGTTQDVALRGWLAKNGLRDAAAGGEVTILAVAASVILDQMRRGLLHGAWLAEPWATRLEQEIGAVRLLDERDLWPGRVFSSAALAIRADRADNPRIRRLVAAVHTEIERANASPDETLDEAYTQMKQWVGNPGSRRTFDAAAKFVDYTPDPVPSSFARFARDGADLGLLPRADGERGLFL